MRFPSHTEQFGENFVIRAAADWVLMFCQSPSRALPLSYGGLRSHLLNQKNINNYFVGFTAVKFCIEFCMISVKSIELFNIINALWSICLN